MGNELAGTVVDLGPDVGGFVVGDRIFVRGHKAEMGAFAEFACVPAELAAKVPDALDFTHAGGVPLAGLTALQVLRDELKVVPGMQILIAGASGGVGTFAVQLAKHMGAEVTATASPAGEALVRSLGADHVIDYTKSRIDQTLGRRFDAAFDLVGGKTLSQLFRVVKPWRQNRIDRRTSRADHGAKRLGAAADCSFFFGCSLNERGYERFAAAGLDRLTVTFAATERVQPAERRTRRSRRRSQPRGRFSPATRPRRAAVDRVVSCAFGCPFEGEVDPGDGRGSVRAARGCGRATSSQTRSALRRRGRVRRLVERVSILGRPVGFHGHNTRNTGYAAAWAAIDGGASRARRVGRRARRLPLLAGRDRQRRDGGPGLAARAGRRRDRRRPRPPGRDGALARRRCSAAGSTATSTAPRRFPKVAR